MQLTLQLVEGNAGPEGAGAIPDPTPDGRSAALAMTAAPDGGQLTPMGLWVPRSLSLSALLATPAAAVGPFDARAHERALAYAGIAERVLTLAEPHIARVARVFAVTWPGSAEEAADLAQGLRMQVLAALDDAPIHAGSAALHHWLSREVFEHALGARTLAQEEVRRRRRAERRFLKALCEGDLDGDVDGDLGGDIDGDITDDSGAELVRLVHRAPQDRDDGLDTLRAA